MDQLRIIEIWWKGPYSMDKIKEKFNDADKHRGLYQIYGTHTIYGPNSLLYIGKVNNQTIANRISQHKWTAVEPSSMQYYIGLLGSAKNIDLNNWRKQIDDAERLLIYFCTPAYNSSGIIKYGDISNTIVLNFDKINCLPYEVSTFYMDSDWWKEDLRWKEFKSS